MDLTTLAAVLGAMSAPVAAVLLATARRRDTRARQWDELVKENERLQLNYDTLWHRHDRLQRRHDTLLGWAYDLRAALREQGIDVPDLPRGIGGDQ